jgi:hypothetical protein
MLLPSCYIFRFIFHFWLTFLSNVMLRELVK